MANRVRGIRKNQFSQGVRQAIKREGPAFFMLISVVAGSATFFIITSTSWEITFVDWRWLALANSLMRLPKTFAELKDSQEPFLIRFARGFQEGFLSPAMIVPDLSKWVTKMRGFWDNLRRN